MDWLTNWFHKLAQSFIWKSILSKITWVDWGTGFFVIAGIILGLKKGLLRMAALLLELLLVIFVTLTYFKHLAGLMVVLVPALPESWAAPVAYVTTGAGVWFLVALIDEAVGKWFHTQWKGPLKQIGGAVLGFIYGLMLWSLISQIFIIGPVPRLKKPYETGNSQTGAVVRQMALKAQLLFSRPGKLFSEEKPAP